jgi:phasin family protein
MTLEMNCAAQYVSFNTMRVERNARMEQVTDNFQKTADEFQKRGKDNYDAMVRSYGELNKGFQAIAARWTEFSKRSFEDATRTWEQLIGAKSLDQALEIQTNYAKRAYDNWMAEASKIGEMYRSAARDAYKPVEKTVTKHTD